MPELMKGATWKARRNKIEYPVYIETKADEVRCHIKINPATNEVQFLSYAGKPLHNMHKFAQMWVALGYLAGRTEFDTGFTVNGSFNDTYRWVRSSNGLPDDLAHPLMPVEFLLFDLPESSGTYTERIQEMTKLLSTPGMRICTVRMPLRNIVHCEERVLELFEEALARGDEGLMGKTMHHKYQRKRSNDWFKVKPSDEADGVIVALHEAVSDTDDPEKGLFKGKRLGRIGSVTIRMEDGSTATPHGIEHGLGREMYLDPQKFLHQWCVMEYMMRDRQGGYRHPVFKRVREEKA